MNNLPAAQQTEITTAPAWSERSDSIAKLAAALSKAQAKIEAAKKESTNPHFRSKYADLSSVWAAIREPLTANELSILQEPGAINGKLLLTTTLLHSSGEYVRSSFEIPVTKQDPQGFGSALTYARRYALQAVVGIAPEDDDGNAASQGVQPQARQPVNVEGVKVADDVAQPQQTGNYAYKVPFAEKDTWKPALVAAGFRWDKDAKKWRGTQPIPGMLKYQVEGPQPEEIDEAVDEDPGYQGEYA